MDLLAQRTGRIDGKALVVELLRDVGVEEALNRIDRDAKAGTDCLLRLGNQAAAASTEVEDALARLQLS
jgi:hypothetical protein